MHKGADATRGCEKSGHEGKATGMAVTRPGRWEPGGRRSMGVRAGVSAPFRLSCGSIPLLRLRDNFEGSLLLCLSLRLGLFQTRDL